MLIGQIVKLTGIRSEDRAPLLVWINDSALVRQHGPFRPVSAMSHDIWFNSIGMDPSHIHLAVRPATGGEEIIGLVQLLNIHSVFRSAELTIRIGLEERRGQGAGSEAVALATEHAFRDLNLERLYLHVFADNDRAVRAYDKAGLQTEGCLRRAAFVDGRWHDVLVMAKLRAQ
ncbi:MAG: GNAT family N-acetyltransferase [Hyphomicrobiaceae bacterium]